jgi:YHS domain-containing protein
MKSLLSITTAIVLFAAVTAVSAQDKPKSDDKSKETAKAELPKCIMMPEETIDVSVKLQTESGPVYFCCAECIDTYKKEPAKHADRVKAQQAAMKKLPRVQVACPLEGGPIDKKAFTEKDGQKIYFCCDKCKSSYDADPAKHAAKLEGSYTYQTKCPVMGKAIDASAFVDLATGQRIYLCCKMCPSKLTGDLEKYAANLETQGIHLDVKKLKAGTGEKKEAAKDAGKKQP